MDYMSNCIFIDESGFNINMNRSIAWTKKGASNITTLGTVAAYGGLNISVRRPKTAERSKEEKKLEEVPHQLSIKEKGGYCHWSLLQFYVRNLGYTGSSRTI